jgi:predicted amidophosphoribosyltransferase
MKLREAPKWLFCAKCGSENVDEAVYCSECGQKLLQVDDLMESPGTSYSEKEILQEMIHVAWKSGMNRKVLYFTNENIYVGEGTLLSGEWDLPLVDYWSSY